MKTRKYFASKEDYEKAYPYVTLLFHINREPEISDSFSSKKNAETSIFNDKSQGQLMTRNQAKKEIDYWKREHPY